MHGALDTGTRRIEHNGERMFPSRGSVVRALPLLAAVLFTAPATHGQTVVARIDAATLRRDVSVLAADSMEGRRTGTPGSARARAYLVRRFREVGLKPFSAFEHTFTFERQTGAASGVNIVGFVPGSAVPGRYIVITAHYDHLGVRDGIVFNGADDNASGTAGLLGLATYFAAHPPRHTMIFAALDAEEAGLRGARAFIATPPVALEGVAINVNLDMVGRNEANELYVAGTYHTPKLRALVDSVAAQAPLKLISGHDQPGTAADDWTNSSDHAPFHAAGIPFLYFGVEDHADYHRATDDVERLAPADFHARAVETVLSVLLRLDQTELARR